MPYVLPGFDATAVKNSTQRNIARLEMNNDGAREAALLRRRTTLASHHDDGLLQCQILPKCGETLPIVS